MLKRVGFGGLIVVVVVVVVAKASVMRLDSILSLSASLAFQIRQRWQKEHQLALKLGAPMLKLFIIGSQSEPANKQTKNKRPELDDDDDDDK